ncbi:MAG: hypothetical protein AAB733_02630 [Patescibacteria group bacterium]
MLEHFVAIQDERKANVLRLNYALKNIVEAAVRWKLGWAADELLSLTPLEFMAWCAGEASGGCKRN